MNPAIWMHLMPESFKERRITEVVIPGTRFSGGYQVCPLTWIEYLISLFPFNPFLTQMMTIMDQLRSGIRYLEFNFYYYSDPREVLISKSGYYDMVCRITTLSQDEIITQINSYSSTHPTEVIVISLTLDRSITDLEEFFLPIILSLSPIIHRKGLTSIKDMIKNGTRLIIISNRIPFIYTDYIYPQSEIGHNAILIKPDQETINQVIRHNYKL